MHKKNNFKTCRKGQIPTLNTHGRINRFLFLIVSVLAAGGCFQSSFTDLNFERNLTSPWARGQRNINEAVLSSYVYNWQSGIGSSSVMTTQQAPIATSICCILQFRDTPHHLRLKGCWQFNRVQTRLCLYIFQLSLRCLRACRSTRHQRLSYYFDI